MSILEKFFAFITAFFISNRVVVQKPIILPTPTPIPTYQVLKVLSGDTFTIQTASGEAQIKIPGGDCMPDGSQQKLETLIGGKQVRLEEVPKLFTDAGLKHISCRPSGFCNVTPVLMYHHIQPLAEAKALGHAGLTVDRDWFDQQVKYLSDHGYQFINVSQLVAAINSKQTLGKSVAITIDDAYDDAFNYAYPILQKYGARASLFVPTGLVQNPGYLTWDQISQMYHSNVVFPYNHTWSHFSLPSGDINKERTEITTAQSQLEEHLGSIPKIFAYPYGGYSPQSIKLLQELGYLAAFSTKPGTWECTGNILYLPRVRIGNYSMSTYNL